MVQIERHRPTNIEIARGYYNLNKRGLDAVYALILNLQIMLQALEAF